MSLKLVKAYLIFSSLIKTILALLEPLNQQIRIFQAVLQIQGLIFPR